MLDCGWQLVVVVTRHRSRWPKELDLNPGDLVQVLFQEDGTWWFGRLPNGTDGYFPASCVEPAICPTGSTGLSEVWMTSTLMLLVVGG